MECGNDCVEVVWRRIRFSTHMRLIPTIDSAARDSYLALFSVSKILPFIRRAISVAGRGFWHSDKGLSQKLESGNISKRLRAAAPRQVSGSSAGHAAVGDTATPRQPLRARLASATSRSCRAFLIASERAGPFGNFRAASRASSACASKSETSVCSACILLRRREQRTFGPLGAGRFHPANRRRNSFIV